MSENETFARVSTRATLTAAPSTLVSALEVAAVLGRSEAWVREHRPAGAFTPTGGRAILARWSEWLEALGYVEPAPEVPAAPPRPRRRSPA